MTRARFFTALFFSVSLLITYAPAAQAQSADAIQAQINQHNQAISDLQAEIAQYQRQLDDINKQKNTLQSTVSALTLSQKQLAAQISVTKNKISSANLKIEELTNSIGDKEITIVEQQSAVGRQLRSMAENDRLPLIEQLFTSTSLSDVWRTIDDYQQLNQALNEQVTQLRQVKTSLAQNRDEVSAAKASLVSLASELATQKRSVDASKAAQQTLLNQTKNKESNYQKLIADKQAAEKAFEDDLVALQSKLDLIVHPGSLPKTGTGILSWPASASFMNNCAARKSVFGNIFCITQYFGTTAFSTANSQVYNGHGHNAIDLGMPIGTPLQAALSGTVIGTGNTDAVKGCYSFGKWILIDHHNGLNTLYAHLSEIDVLKGQNVTTGQAIGLSGMTGYATGPHLHFGVYASEGTEIMDLAQWRGKGGTPCTNGGAMMPVATLDAYLNPLSYL